LLPELVGIDGLPDELRKTLAERLPRSGSRHAT